MINIYIITNTITQKRYVGQTTRTVSQRISRQLSGATELSKALKKHGQENFRYEVIRVAKDQQEADIKERELIEEHNTLYPNGYNLQTGGIGNFEISDKTRERLRKSHLGHKPTQETRRKMSKAQKQAQLRPEVVRAKRKRMLGNKLTHGVEPWNKGVTGEDSHAYGNQWAKGNQSWMGRKHTEESKRRISENNWMKDIDPEKHPFYGQKHTQEARNKMSIAMKNRKKLSRAIPVTINGVKFPTKKAACEQLGWSFGKLQRHLQRVNV
jgi:group I intron endonuclease